MTRIFLLATVGVLPWGCSLNIGSMGASADASALARSVQNAMTQSGAAKTDVSVDPKTGLIVIKTEGGSGSAGQKGEAEGAGTASAQAYQKKIEGVLSFLQVGMIAGFAMIVIGIGLKYGWPIIARFLKG